jgi:hypothetical protein|tara:strand:+ start:99 stop:329 length:231 start_codon:yes stop_codon:yes gene_type:complete
VLRFFGLTPENKDIILEQIFTLMQHLSFTYNDAYKLPVWKRIWFLRKLKYNLEQEKQNISSQQSNKNLKNMFKKSF